MPTSNSISAWSLPTWLLGLEVPKMYTTVAKKKRKEEGKARKKDGAQVVENLSFEHLVY